MTGGYCDAGDNVKFGFPMAFTTTMLSWSVIEFGKFMGEELQNAKDAIRWGTDYLLKATAVPGTVYVQVLRLCSLVQETVDIHSRSEMFHIQLYIF